jgi:hypothetical protein
MEFAMLGSLIMVLPALLALAAAPATAAGSQDLRVGTAGTVSVDLEDAPLDWVLESLGAALGVEVVVDGSLHGTVSARFGGVPPARAVRRLVGSRPLLMRWTADGALSSIRVCGERAMVALTAGEPGAVVAAGVVPETDPAPPVGPVAEIDEASLRTLDRQLAQRVRHVETDWRRAASAAVIDDLGEGGAPDDPGARRDAIRALVGQGDGVAVARLGELLETETDPGLRRLAIGALAGIDDPLARDLVAAALE